MSNNQTFPSNYVEALTMLYIENLDLSSLSPELLFEKYQETYDRIKKHDEKINPTKTWIS